MPTGYCTLADIRRALRKAQLPGDLSQDKQIAVDAIVAETEPLEKELSLHWYAQAGDSILDEASEIDIPTTAITRDDEYDIPTRGGMVHGSDERERYLFDKNSDALLESGPRSDRRRRDRADPKRRIRIATGEYRDIRRPRDDDTPTYTRVRLDRRAVDTINELLVIGSDGTYTDWVSSADYDGGVGLSHRGEDYWVRINNNDVADLYLDVHALDDEIASLSNAVYVDYDHGHEGIPRAIRRAVAHRAAAQFTEQAVIEIPTNATIYNIETKADELRSKADTLLSEYRLDNA